MDTTTTESNSIEVKKGIKELKIPKFEDIPVSTKTSIVMTNITVDIKKVYEQLPVTPYTVIPRKRGRKRHTTDFNPNQGIPTGAIIMLEYKSKLRGVRLKKKKKSAAKSGEDYFRNSVTIVMVVDNKHINFKISQNGKFQMTGCKKDDHAKECVRHIWNYVKGTDMCKLEGKEFCALFIPAMRNIDFSLGFSIDREKIDQYFNQKTPFRSLLETSVGYTGVNLKIPFDRPITDLKIQKYTWDEKKNDWCEPQVLPFNDYLSLLKPKEREKRLNKQRYHTFLIFHSGKVIMSSLCADFARQIYYQFMDIIQNHKDHFKESLN